MKQALVNGRWNLWLPDNIADWDAITGDYTARRGWEFERFESFRKHLRYGDTFVDVGAEHGWISAIIAREFVGAENMVLCEPSSEFWVNIRKTWKYNGLDDPLMCWPGFLGSVSSVDVSRLSGLHAWPPCADHTAKEVLGMAYRSLANGVDATVMTATLDELVGWHLHTQPDALNIDVEGAELLVLLGAHRALTSDSPLRNVWVSIHPDLMANFDHTPGMVHDFMAECGWKGEHLATDHEEHWHFIRR